MKLKPEQCLYVRSMGRALRVTAMFTDTTEANRHMEKSGNTDAVVAEFGPYILLANVHDKGERIERHQQ